VRAPSAPIPLSVLPLVRSSAARAVARALGRRYEETANCMICTEGDWEEDNVILFCDGCNLAVHQVCYGGGAVAIPDGPWYCDRCDPARRSGPAVRGVPSFFAPAALPAPRWPPAPHPSARARGRARLRSRRRRAARCAARRAQECCLCPMKGGALKRTTDWRWAHVVCALWVPNVSFADPESRDAVDLFGMDEKRFSLTCSLCGQHKGACIQCKERKCMRAFHGARAGWGVRARARRPGAGWVSGVGGWAGTRAGADGHGTDGRGRELRRVRSVLAVGTPRTSPPFIHARLPARPPQRSRGVPFPPSPLRAVTCARKHGLHMTEKERHDWVEFSVYCDKHKPKGQRRRKKGAV
jgi:NuA3 HAT complex component NTO1